MDVQQWISGMTSDSAREIAKRANISERTLQNQLATGRISVENLVKISSTYGKNPLRTLIEWNIVDPIWESVPNIDAALRVANNEQLVNEVLRRMQQASPETSNNADELAHRRAAQTASTINYHDGTVRDWDEIKHLPHAADSSLDEDQLREERGEDFID